MKISREEAILIAQVAAYEHRNEHDYLPKDWDATMEWRPHEWVITAIQDAVREHGS